MTLMRSRAAAGAILCSTLLTAPGGRAADDVSGTWLTANGLSHVRVQPCGASRCGTIVWTKAEARDVRNPDPGQRNRPMLGLRIFGDARSTSEGWTGTLYNPLDGRTYTGKMRLTRSGELELSGCVLAGLICQSQVWTRVR